MRATDFRNSAKQRLPEWPETLEEIQILPKKQIESDLTVFGNIDITFNPSGNDLFDQLGKKGLPLIEYLLRGQMSGQHTGLSEEDLKIFLRVYSNMYRTESTEFARNLEREGEAELRKHLRRFGFDTRPLSQIGQLTMKTFLDEFRDGDSARISLPSEPGLFGKAHGQYSHVLQMTALLHGLSREEAKAVYRVLRQITHAIHPEMWLAWSGLFNSFAGDGPNTTSWWPDSAHR